MIDYLKNLDKKALKVLKLIGKEADLLDCRAYLVGGVVRDLILKRENLDLDVVVEYNAFEIANKVANELKAKLTIHPEFKTASLCIEGLRVDFATCRRESYSHSGVLPQVELGNLEDDLFRRDFTINALAISINRNSFGNLIDKFGGMVDIENKIIRVLHEKSFIDDPTRILRAIRFEQRLKFRLELGTRELLISALKEKVFLKVKPQRYFAEFRRVLKENEPLLSLRRLNEFKGLDFIRNNYQFDKPLLSIIAKNFNALNKSMRSSTLNKELYYLIGLFNGFDITYAQELFTRFNFKKEERQTILQAKKYGPVKKTLMKAKIKPSQIYQMLKPFNDQALIYFVLISKNSLIKKRVLTFLKEDKAIKLNINGHDVDKLGIVSSKLTGEVLKQVLYEKIDRRINNKKQELLIAKQYLRKAQHGQD